MLCTNEILEEEEEPRERTSALSRGRCVTLEEEKNATAMQFVLLFSWQWHKERERERGGGDGKESLLVACVDVSDGRADGQRINSGEGSADSGLHFCKQRRKRKISPRSHLPYQV